MPRRPDTLPFTPRGLSRVEAAGLSNVLLSWADIVAMMDADMPAKKRGPYKKRTAENSN